MCSVRLQSRKGENGNKKECIRETILKVFPPNWCRIFSKRDDNGKGIFVRNNTTNNAGFREDFVKKK